MIKWEERQGVLDRLQAIANNPNPHMQSTGGDTADVLDRLGTISKGLLLLLDPPSPFDRGEAPTVGEFDYPTKDSGVGP